MKRTIQKSMAMMAGLVLAGCGREAISTYQIPKENYSPPAVHAHEAPLPHVHWDLPKGWEDRSAEQKRIGSFRIPGEGEKSAEVRIVPLREMAGMEARTVNMWREELGLPPSTNDVQGAEVEAAGLRGNLYDLNSEELRFQGKHKARTTAAIVPRQGILWFIKMSGEESVVAQQQQPFRDFLKSLAFHDEEHEADTAAAAASPEGPNMANWKVPPSWKQEKAGEMVLAAYTATAKNGAAANITVTSFPGDVGGLLANVNRWRGQVQLAPIAASDLAKEVKSIDLSSGDKATAVDLQGASKRLYGLVVPRGGQTWFYKMVGDKDAVAAEMTNLAEFAATAH